eukprot:tig00000828_g4630.t1
MPVVPYRKDSKSLPAHLRPRKTVRPHDVEMNRISEQLPPSQQAEAERAERIKAGQEKQTQEPPRTEERANEEAEQRKEQERSQEAQAPSQTTSEQWSEQKEQSSSMQAEREASFEQKEQQGSREQREGERKQEEAERRPEDWQSPVRHGAWTAPADRRPVVQESGMKTEEYGGERKDEAGAAGEERPAEAEQIQRPPQEQAQPQPQEQKEQEQINIEQGAERKEEVEGAGLQRGEEAPEKGEAREQEQQAPQELSPEQQQQQQQQQQKEGAPQEQQEQKREGALPRLLVTTRLPDSVLDLLREAFDVDMFDGDSMPRDQLLGRVKGAEGLLVTVRDQVNAELIEAAGGSLKFVSTASIGYDHIDAKTCADRGIKVSRSASEVHATADYTVGLLLAAGRRIAEANFAVRNGDWQKNFLHAGWLEGTDLWNSKVLIVGLGAVGREVANRLKGFNCDIRYWDKQQIEGVEGLSFQEDLDAALGDADFVSVHLTLSDETRGLFNSDRLSKMKNTAVLCNTSRGEIVDSNALADALANRSIAGAALDVVENGPPAPDPARPRPAPALAARRGPGAPGRAAGADNRLVQLPNCLLTPHIASNTRAASEFITRSAAMGLREAAEKGGAKAEAKAEEAKPEVSY